jgi:hypothetical protein
MALIRLIAVRQPRRVVIHIIAVAMVIQMTTIKVLIIIVRQLRIVVNPIVMTIIAVNPPNQIIIAVVIRRIAVQKDTAITEEVEIASLEAIHFFREYGF